MDAPIPVIEVAYRGRVAMLRAIFGGTNPDGPSNRQQEKSEVAMTPEMFGALLGPGRAGRS